MAYNRYNPHNKSFACDRYCGECCKTLIVELTNEDIKKIRSLGYVDEDFVTIEMGPTTKKVLRKTKQGCIFLKKENDGMYSCSIHDSKPDICRGYPQINKQLTDCRPSTWPKVEPFNVRMRV